MLDPGEERSAKIRVPHPHPPGPAGLLDSPAAYGTAVL